MARTPVETYFFSLVVARHEDRFLLVQERKHGQTWYVPAGGVEPGESFAAAAVRETREEAGVDVRLTGVLRFEHSPLGARARCRMLFAAEPIGDPTPKQVSDDDTLGADWFTLAQIRQLPLRGREVVDMLESVERGAPVFPMALIEPEGAPWRFLA